MSEKVTILRGVVGSTAYGLAHANSDIDRIAIHVAPVEKVLGLQGHAVITHTDVTNHPDVTSHEVAKYLALALKGNPTVTEAVWLSEYEILTPAGERLVEIRKTLLGAKSVRSAYAGYAVQQARRLCNRADAGKVGFDPDIGVKRIAKHGRHCMRLLLQAEELLRTGHLTVNVGAYRDELFAAGERAEESPYAYRDEVERRAYALDDLPSQLPDRPDKEVADRYLIDLRKECLDSPL